jgi:translation elongation factor EF-4
MLCTGADPERVKREVEEVVGLDCSKAILASAKQGIGIEEILEAVVDRIPPPPDTRSKPLRALIFDSKYDPYKVTCHASAHLASTSSRRNAAEHLSVVRRKT